MYVGCKNLARHIRRPREGSKWAISMKYYIQYVLQQSTGLVSREQEGNNIDR